MPGFGYGAFGTQPFGQWPWSKSVLYDLLPGLYQQQDLLYGGVLQTWTQSLRYSFDLMTNLIANWSDLRNPYTVRTAYDEVTTIVLGSVVTPPAPVLQRGVDGSISASRQFSSPTARFTQANVGNTITLSQSHIPTNNRTFVVASVITPTTITCTPQLIVDTGPVRWTLQGLTPLPEGVIAVQVQAGDVSMVAPGWVLFDGFSQFTVYERQQFFALPGGQTSTLTVKDGSQGMALGDGTFKAEVPFAQTNVGQPFSVSGSTVTVPNSDFTNNGKYQIYSINPADPTILTFDAPLIIQGTLITGQLDPNSSVIYTMTIGQTGIQILHLVYGPSSALFVVVSGLQISVYLATDVNSIPTSTAAEVAAAVNSVPAASALVTVTHGGSGASLAVPAGIQTIPGTRLLPDSGPLTWSLLPFPQLQLVTSSPPAGIITQQGVDLTLIGATATSTTATWSASDVGNVLVVLGSLLGNNQTFAITGVLSATEVEISPVTVPSGSTASIVSYTLPLSTVTGLSGITPSMVGLYLNFSGAASPGNNGNFQIITYFSSSSVAVENLAGVAPDTNNGTISWGLVDGPLTWAEHTLSGVGFGSSVTLNAPSLIDFLAQDFGITIDDQESEARQRSWVANVTQWIGYKGTALGYQIIGAISGFNVAASALYRISQLASEGLPDTSLYIVAESGEGNAGIDGSLTITSGLVTLTAASAVFTSADVGLVVQTGNCAISANNGLYTISEYVSPSIVQFATYNSAVTPDYGIFTSIASGSNGQTLPQATVHVESTADFPPVGTFAVDGSVVNYTGLTTTSFTGCTSGTATMHTGDAVGNPTLPNIQWDVCRIYTTEPPTRPLFDQVNGELMQSIVGTMAFEVDTYCWEPYFINHIPIDITSVSPPVSSSVSTYFTVTAQGVALPSLSGTHASVTSTATPPLPALPYAVVTGLSNMTSSWEGAYLELSGALSAGNNGLFPILEVVSSSIVHIYNPGAVPGDGHNGSIVWSVPSAAAYSSAGVIEAAGPWQLTDSSGQISFVEPNTDSFETLQVGSGTSLLTFTAQDPGTTNIAIVIVSGGSLSVTVFYRQIIITVGGTTTALDVASAINSNLSAVALVAVTFGGVGSGIVVPITTIASGSNGATLPQSVVHVSSTALFPATGSFAVDQSIVYYTGKTLTSFTGCVGGTATLSTGDGVGMFLQGGTNPTELLSVGPPSVYSFEVFSDQVPALGAGTLTYNCQILTSCSYCQASAVILLITEGSIAGESGPAIINVLDRLILRLQQEVTPIHVRLVPVFQQVLYAVWGS